MTRRGPALIGRADDVARRRRSAVFATRLHRREHLEQPRTRAVERELDVSGSAAKHVHLDLVLAIDREYVIDQDPATRPEGQTVEMHALIEIAMDPELQLRGRRSPPDGETAHTVRHGEIGLHERLRQPQRRRDVVERHVASTRVVDRQEVTEVHVDREEVAHGVPVLRPIETMETLGAPGPRISGSDSIELGLEPGHEPVVGNLVGAWSPWRGHQAATQLAHDLLP